jgi:hypothetical protein
MNTISLNNLWSYLQGLTLSASNKKWLADHLYEAALAEEKHISHEKRLENAAMIRQEKERELWVRMPKVTSDDMKIAPWLDEMVKDVESMSADEDVEKVRLNYLMDKYR